MTMWQFLRCLFDITADHRARDDDGYPRRALFRRPGMHQNIEEDDELTLTVEDQRFLRRLGIQTRSVECARSLD